MTERPILFSAPMVRAILAGTKTQTRRVVKLPSFIAAEADDGDTPSEVNDLTTLAYLDKHDAGPRFWGWMTEYPEEGSVPIRCPYGTLGDRLWVRETWRILGDSPADTLDMFDRDDVQYRADDDQSYIDKYRPSIHMPRRFSRIDLEITDVRVERLQDISDADAIAEGISEFIGGWWCEHDDVEQIAGMTPQEGYRHLWERINGAGSWEANPWVWVVEFRRITQ